MNSLQRVLTALSHQEPDRVPLFLLLTMHGAKELGLSIRTYFSKAEYVAEGQLRLLQKYQHDCVYNFYYASLELEAFGGSTRYIDDGPPTALEPVFSKAQDITSAEAPRVDDCACLQKVLASHRLLKSALGDTVPIIGVVMSPFSLPVMQLGFDHYLDLLYEQPALLARLMQINQEFCVEWANAQLAAGATAICYFDPVSSSTMVTRQQYLDTGFPIARQTIARIQGPTATHFASGRCLPILDLVPQTGTAAIGVSADEDLAQLKEKAKGKVSLLGNINGIELRRWTVGQVEAVVKNAIAQAGRGGGFILSDNHGEIPFQISADSLHALSSAVKTWGQYPLDWIEE